MSTQVSAPPRSRELRDTYGPARHRVAWGLVTGCALVMVLADGFLVIALRGVAGSIERTDHLFVSWLRESLLLMPLYVAAVLAAVASVQRRHSRGHRRHATAALLGSISLAGTLAAVLWTAASAAYDYRLQEHELLDMPAMRAACTGSCPQQMQHASLLLQERILGMAAAAFLLGNLLLVVWVWAMRGGVLVPAATPRGRPLAQRDVLAVVRLVLATSLAGAALIHLAVVPEHLAEWPLAASFFVVLAVAELGAGGLVLARRSLGVLASVALLSALPLVLWALSRTQGMPFGPESGTPEAVGFADVAACVLEAITLVCCVLTARRGRWLHRPVASPYAQAMVLTTLLAVTTLGLGGTALPGVHAFGVAGHGEGTDTTSVPAPRLPGSLVPPSEPGSGSP